MKFVLLKSLLVVSFLIAVFCQNSCKCCQKKTSAKKENKKVEANDKCKCDLIPDPGLCKAYFPRYYFDKKEGKCKEFIWGGCDGVVPFQTLEACEKCGCTK